MNEKRKAPLWLITFVSVILTYVPLEFFKEDLPLAIREEIDKIDEKFLHRVSEEDKGRAEEIIDPIKNSITDTDNRVADIVDQKIAELEKEYNIAETTGTAQGIQVSNSAAIPNQYFPSYNFSDETYYKMVKLAAAEQGNTNKRGMAVEMSVMFNLYEGPIYNKIFKRSTEEEGFVEFISTNGNHREADFLIMLNI